MPVEDDYMMVIIPCIAEIAASDTPERVKKLRLGAVSELQRYLHSYLLVGAIGIYRNGDIPRQKDMEEIGSIGVDAGLAGFFHNKPDYSDEEWGRFCDRVRNGDAWLTEDGFYSSSGYGDGCYGVYAYKQDGAITALELRFL